MARSPRWRTLLGPARTRGVTVAAFAGAWAVVVAAGPWGDVTGQAAADTIPPPMKTGADRLVTAATLAGFRDRTEDPGKDVDWYNLGAALLLSGDWEGSVEPLRQALETDDEGVESSATYDLALARALAGRPPELGGTLPFDERRPLLEQAWEGFRWVLRRDPAAEDARWNLELVARWLEQEEDPTDEGGGGGGAASAADQAERPSTPELSPAEALDLLEQAAEEERDVQGRRLERNRSRDPVVDRNW